MEALITAQGKSAQLVSVHGRPTGLREGVVCSVEAHGAIGVQMTTGRAGVVEAAVPTWYRPQVGDKVLVGELNGNPAMPVVIAPRAGDLAVYAPSVNTTGKTSAQITAALSTGVVVDEGLMIFDPTNKLLLVYSGSKWLKTSALTEIA